MPDPVFPPALVRKVVLASRLAHLLEQVVKVHRGAWDALEQNAPKGDSVFQAACSSRKDLLQKISSRSYKVRFPLPLLDKHSLDPSRMIDERWLREVFTVEVAEDLLDLLAEFVGLPARTEPVLSATDLSNPVQVPFPPTGLMAEIEKRRAAAATLEGLKAPAGESRDGPPYEAF